MKTRTTLCLWVCAGALCLPSFSVGVPPEAGAPEDLSRPLRIVQTIRPAFPARLAKRGVSSGEVRLWLEVDASGVLVDQLVVGYTHRELAGVIEDAARFWQYLPAEFEGRGIATTTGLIARFEKTGITFVDRNVTEATPSTGVGYAYFAREEEDLDRPLSAQRAPAPINPARYGEPALVGRARVDFFVDERGRVRMPIVVSADNERLGWAALSAIKQWRFDPPLRKERSVLVRASQTFRFESATN